MKNRTDDDVMLLVSIDRKTNEALLIRAAQAQEPSKARMAALLLKQVLR